MCSIKKFKNIDNKKQSCLVFIRNLGGLAFLDLAQNHIQDITAADLGGLTSLTALNLERNVIQKLDDDLFQEVKRSLSSLSLLNNLLTQYPEGAITSLKDLRVSQLSKNVQIVSLQQC